MVDKIALEKEIKNLQAKAAALSDAAINQLQEVARLEKIKAELLLNTAELSKQIGVMQEQRDELSLSIEKRSQALAEKEKVNQANEREINLAMLDIDRIFKDNTEQVDRIKQGLVDVANKAKEVEALQMSNEKLRTELAAMLEQATAKEAVIEARYASTTDIREQTQKTLIEAKKRSIQLARDLREAEEELAAIDIEKGKIKVQLEDIEKSYTAIREANAEIDTKKSELVNKELSLLEKESELGLNMKVLKQARETLNKEKAE